MSKTERVEDIRRYCNDLLKNPKLSDEFKQGVETVIEHILHETGNYAGFKYNYWNDIGYKLWKEAGEPPFPEKQKFIGNEHDRYYF